MAPAAAVSGCPRPDLPRIAPAPDWIATVPTVNAVRAAFPGQGPNDEARRSGALEVMIKFVTAVVGWSRFDTHCMPPDVAGRLKEYTHAPNTPHTTAATLERGYQLAELFQFQQMVLGKLVTKQSQDAYWSTSDALKLKHTTQAQTPAPGIVPVVTGGPASPEDLGNSTATRDLLTSDMAEAKQKGVDTHVFGIALGEPLMLRPCPAPGNDDFLGALGMGNVPEICIGSGFNGMFNQLFALKSSRFSNAPLVAVRLPRNRCPEWMAGACDVSVAVKDGYAFAAFATVGGEDWQGEIEARIGEKYPRANLDKSRFSQCKNRDLGLVTQRAKVRVWTMPGLRVTYDPLGGFCASSQPIAGAGSGQIIVETSTFIRLTEQAEQNHRASQPKM
jgi:hypothetical protein